ncbi:hypothetical protein BH09SUM1_BH09SUM1_04510 [soil metagenome]
MNYLLFLIPILSFAFLVLWVWALINTLRFERSYFWLWVLVLIPPLALPAYWLNFTILGDEKAGLTRQLRKHGSAREAKRLEALLVDSDFPGRRFELAQLYFEQGRIDEALQNLKRVLDYDEENIRAQYLTARALIIKQMDTAAEPHLAYVVECDPSHAGWNAQKEYAALLARLGKRDEAINEYRKLITRIGAPESIFHYAQLLYAAGRKEEARAAAERLLADYQRTPGVFTRADAQWIKNARTLLATIQAGG